MTKENSLSRFIPVLTTEAGTCLTLANWQEAGATAVSYQLESLLVKPGLSFLKKLPNLRAYVGWQHTLILNALLPPINKHGVYKLRSPYDGSILSITKEEVAELIAQLQPDIAILPADLELSQISSLSQIINSFVPPKIGITESFGWHLSYDPSMSLSMLQEQIETLQAKPIYLTGELDLQESTGLANYDSLTIESNLPAQNAFLGKVYCEGNILDLLNVEMTHQHALIDEACQCVVCQQKFTRAYFHHLIIQTPLLCQRLLIQHNVHYYQNHR